MGLKFYMLCYLASSLLSFKLNETSQVKMSGMCSIGCLAIFIAPTFYTLQVHTREME